jgi:hypothetical protein
VPCPCREETRLWDVDTDRGSLFSLMGSTILCWQLEDRNARLCSKDPRRDVGGQQDLDRMRNEAIKSV